MINVIDLLDGDLRAWHYKVPKIKIPIIIKNDIKIRIYILYIII